MRDTAGSAAAPAARCRNCLRWGSFMASLPGTKRHSKATGYITFAPVRKVDHGSFWPKADLPRCPLWCRCWGLSRHGKDMFIRSRITLSVASLRRRNTSSFRFLRHAIKPPPGDHSNCHTSDPKSVPTRTAMTILRMAKAVLICWSVMPPTVADWSVSRWVPLPRFGYRSAESSLWRVVRLHV